MQGESRADGGSRQKAVTDQFEPARTQLADAIDRLVRDLGHVVYTASCEQGRPVPTLHESDAAHWRRLRESICAALTDLKECGVGAENARALVRGLACDAASGTAARAELGRIADDCAKGIFDSPN
jgi:hypothetical protein